MKQLFCLLFNCIFRRQIITVCCKPASVVCSCKMFFFVYIVFERVNEEGEDSIDVSGNNICIYGVQLKGFST